MKSLANVIYNVGASIAASAKVLLPFLLIVLLMWFLVETGLAVWASRGFQYLAILVGLILVAVIVIVWKWPVVRWTEAANANRPLDPSPAVPLLFWNLGLILVLMYLADLRMPKANFTTPLLRLYQFLYRQVTG